MSLQRTLCLLAAVAACCSARPCSSQSFYHAPAARHGEPLLPLLDPAQLFEAAGLRADVGSRGRQAWPAGRADRNDDDFAIDVPPAAGPAGPAGPPPASAPPSVAGMPAPFVPDPSAKPILPTEVKRTRWVPINQGSRTAPAVAAAPPSQIRYVPDAVVPAAFTPPPAAAPPAAPPAFDTPVAARALAAKALAEGNGETAEAILSEASVRFADDADVAMTLGRLRESREDWPGAVAAYDAVVRLQPGDTRWLVRRAECLYQAGEFAAAVADYREAASVPDALSDGEYARYGDAALQAGDPATAEEAFTALGRLPGAPIARVELLRGMAVLKQGDTARARDILLRANARWPRDEALTDALRIAAAKHYGDAAPPTARKVTPPAPPSEVETRTAMAETEAQVVTASAETLVEHVAPEPASSGWRPTIASRDPSSIGWRATRLNQAN